MFSKAFRHLIEKAIRNLKRDPNYHLDESLTSRAILTIASYRILGYLRGFRWRLLLKEYKGAFFVGKRVTIRHAQYLSLGRSVTLDDNVNIDALSQNGIVLGDNVSVGAYTIIETTGILSKLGKGFKIGSNSNLGDYCFVGAAGGVEIGENVLIGQRVSFHSENHIYDQVNQPIRHQGTTQQGIIVQDDCWLGSGAIILDGVTIHKGSVVAAGSVVTEDIPENAVVGGVPARILKMRQSSLTEEV